MPIGKNSIKRVANNGYSNVKTNTPDMENSTVLANPSPEVIEKMIPSAEKLAPKKSTAKKAPAKKPATKKVEAISSTKEEEKLDGFIRVELGGELPTYLL